MSKCVHSSRPKYSPSTCSSSALCGRESLNSSVASCSSSVSSRWEEMNLISKELHSYAIKNLSISDDSSVSPLSTRTASQANIIPNKPGISDLDSTLDLLKNYIEKYNCKPTKKAIDSSFEDSLYRNSSTQPNIKQYLDTTISSIAPVADETARPIDDLLSLCSESTLTTNSDELYGKLEFYSEKYLFKSGARREPKLDISFTSVDKENIKPKVKKSKVTTKTNTVMSSSVKKTRPQSVKVSTLKSIKSTNEEKKPKKGVTPKRATTPTPRSVKTNESKKISSTTKSKRSSSTSKLPSANSVKHKIVIPKSPEVPTYVPMSEEELSLPGTPLEPSANLSSCSLASTCSVSTVDSVSIEEIIIHEPNYGKEVESKSCQTSMMAENKQSQSSVVQSKDDSLATLGGDDEIAFKIVGATDKIEKVEVYLKNSKSHAPQNHNQNIEQPKDKVTIQEAPYYTNQATQVNNQSPKSLNQYNDRVPSSPEHYSSSSYSSSSEDADNALEKLKSIYNRYFIQNHQI